MVYSASFNSISDISWQPVHLSMLPGSSFNQYSAPLLQTHWLLSHIIIVKILDSSERGMIIVAMTIINPRKGYWPSPGIEPTTYSSQVFSCYQLSYGSKLSNHFKLSDTIRAKCKKCSYM